MFRSMILTFTLLSLFILSDICLSASPTSFCKCTCFTNSTIIPLDAPVSPTFNKALLSSRSGWAETDDAQEPVPDKSSGSNDGSGGSDNDGAGADDDDDEDDQQGKGDADDKGGSGKKKEEEGNNDHHDGGDTRKEYRAGNCADCNRQFCLDYNLPICKHAGMEDVFTTCFQRDSRKDEAVVFIFIFATVGLLIWAAVKPWFGGWVDSARERSTYIPVSGNDT